MRETWRQRSQATVKVPRSAKGLSEVDRTLSDSGRASEYNARLPTGRATVEGETGWVSAVDAEGTQNSARLPRGSGVRPASLLATFYFASMAASTVVARER
jgi:hypothetical protein